MTLSEESKRAPNTARQAQLLPEKKKKQLSKFADIREGGRWDRSTPRMKAVNNQGQEDFLGSSQIRSSGCWRFETALTFGVREHTGGV